MAVKSVPTTHRSQADHLPADAQVPEGVKEVPVRARGVDRMISPAGHTWDGFFLNGPQASDDFMAERMDPPHADREGL